MHLVLVGSKACGKSTVGRIVARTLGLPFEDTDSVLEAIHAERTGERIPFREIYRERGEGYFRELEEEALRRSFRPGGRVVALGGGMPVRLNLEEALAEDVVVYLEASDDALWARMSRDGLPAYLDPADPRADFERILAERKPAYERIADLRLDAGRSPEVIAAEIVSHWKDRVQAGQRGKSGQSGRSGGSNG